MKGKHNDSASTAYRQQEVEGCFFLSNSNTQTCHEMMITIPITNKVKEPGRRKQENEAKEEERQGNKSIHPYITLHHSLSDGKSE